MCVSVCAWALKWGGGGLNNSDIKVNITLLELNVESAAVVSVKSNVLNNCTFYKTDRFPTGG